MGTSRRAFLAAAIAGLGGAAAYWTWNRSKSGALLRATPAPITTGRIREYSLEARPADWAIAEGRSAPAWTYNGLVPGPMIRATQGDILRVTLKNQLPESTTIHWHGVPVPFGMDGVPELTQPAVPPGGTFVYEFLTTRPGTYWYHTHSGYQLDRGLYGALIIEPPREELAYDQDYTLVFDDWLSDPDHPRPNPDAGGMMSMGMEGMRGGMSQADSSNRMDMPGAPRRVEPLYDALIVNGMGNGRVPELRARLGDRIRLRLVNAGSALPLGVRVRGHTMRVTHADGQPVTPCSTKVAVLGMGERLDVMVEADHPGAWPVTAFGRGGLAVSAVLRYDGIHAAAPPDTGDEDVDDADVLSYLQLSGVEAVPASSPAGEYDLKLSGDMMDPSFWTINERQYPDVPPILVHRGDVVRFRVFNMSMMPHPMHLHGHFFRLLEVNGEKLRHPILKDTVTIGHMESFKADVLADNPGARWLLHCHNLYHHMGGMGMEVRYD